MGFVCVDCLKPVRRPAHRPYAIMPVPLLDVNAQNLPLESKFQQVFLRVLRSGQFILGPEVENFEKAIANYTKSRHALGVSSGTDAILLALMALQIGHGDEVLVPTFTFFATAGCVSRVGATPVFVDVCPLCFNMDVRDAARKLTRRTKAVIPVHLFGQAACMDEILTLAEKRGLRVIEDAAQALGAEWRGRPCGSMGHFGTFSFFPSKNLGGFGDAGALITQDEALAERARILRTHGANPKYFHQFVGANFRIDPLQTAMLMVKLPMCDSYAARRRANAQYYTQKLLNLEGVVQATPPHCPCTLGSSSESTIIPKGTRLVLPVECPGKTHIWNQYTLRVMGGSPARDALKAHLQAAGIGCEIYYPLTLDQQACFASTPSSSRRGCENSHLLASQVLSIPIYPELTTDQKDEVIACISDWLKSGKQLSL